MVSIYPKPLPYKIKKYQSGSKLQNGSFSSHPQMTHFRLPGHWKISFSRISQEVSIFGHMLLHKLYINMAIANILVYPKSLYDLPGPKYEIRILRESQEKGRGHMGMMPNSARLSPGLNFF